MSLLAPLRELNHTQRHTVLASFLGWTLDAFDYFLLTFVIVAVAKEFGVDNKAVTYGLFLTLAARPIGALLFGRLADRFGRRPILMLDIILFSVFELATAFSPSLTVLLVLRFLFGVAMGGEWGIGASLAMESIPAKSRGLISGLLQSGYPCGFFLAALANWLLVDHIGWRGLFIVGAVPALLVLYIRRSVPESPGWQPKPATRRGDIGSSLRSHWRRGLYAIVLMTAFNFFSHGTQDIYPTFLQVQHGLSSHAVGVIAMIYNIGAIGGGLFFGSLSERFGRRRCIIIAALLSLPVIPLWAYGSTPVLLASGAFLMQFMVQGAWGVIPAHLNELSPETARATFPGVVYQLGNLLASVNAPLQAGIAGYFGGDYALALAAVAATVAVVIAVLTALGSEARGVSFSPPAREAPAQQGHRRSAA